MDEAEKTELTQRIAAVLVENGWVAESEKAKAVSENLVDLIEMREAKLLKEFAEERPLQGQPRLCPTCDGAGKVLPWTS